MQIWLGEQNICEEPVFSLRPLTDAFRNAKWLKLVSQASDDNCTDAFLTGTLLRKTLWASVWLWDGLHIWPAKTVTAKCNVASSCKVQHRLWLQCGCVTLNICHGWWFNLDPQLAWPWNQPHSHDSWIWQWQEKEHFQASHFQASHFRTSRLLLTIIPPDHLHNNILWTDASRFVLTNYFSPSATTTSLNWHVNNAQTSFCIYGMLLNQNVHGYTSSPSSSAPPWWEQYLGPEWDQCLAHICSHRKINALRLDEME